MHVAVYTFKLSNLRTIAPSDYRHAIVELWRNGQAELATYHWEIIHEEIGEEFELGRLNNMQQVQTECIAILLQESCNLHADDWYTSTRYVKRIQTHKTKDEKKKKISHKHYAAKLN